MVEPCFDSGRLLCAGSYFASLENSKTTVQEGVETHWRCLNLYGGINYEFFLTYGDHPAP